MNTINFKYTHHQEPDESLKPYVKFYSYIKFEPAKSPVWIPADRRNQILFLKEGKVQISCNDEEYMQSEVSFRPVINKVLTVNFMSDFVEVVNIEFTATGIYHLFELDMVAFINKIYAIESLFPPNFLNQINPDNFKELFDRFLLNILGSRKENTTVQQIRDAIHIAEKRKGKLEIKDVPGLLGVNSKKFYRNFKKYTGLPPKQYFSIVQFEAALLEILKNREVDKMDLVNGSGYYDQAHFIKAVQKFTGCSPEKIKQIDKNWIEFLIQNEIY